MLTVNTNPTILPDELWTYLRKHQKAGFMDMIRYDVCRGMMPTGSGKSALEAALMLYNILEEDSGFGIHIVLCPRIMLTTQLCLETQKIIGLMCGVRTQNLIVNSGGLPAEDAGLQILRTDFMRKYGKPFILKTATTSQDAIQKEIEEAGNADRPVCIYGTYQSAEQIIQVLRKKLDVEADTLVSDESHFLVCNQYRKLLDNNVLKGEDKELLDGIEFKIDDLEKVVGIPAKRKYFLTATEKTTGDKIKGLGNNNEYRFGPRAYEYTIRQAVDDGVICPPKLGKLYGCNLEIRDCDSMGHTVKEAFERAHEHFLDVCGHSGKLLVNTVGSEQMLWFLHSKQNIELREQHVNVAVVSSNSQIGNYLNGERLNRASWLSKVKQIGEDSTAKLIILHHNILTVGIDIPGLNALMVLYYKDMIFFLQSLGRILRKCGNKPYGLIMVPDYFDLADVRGIVRTMLIQLLKAGFTAEELVNILEPRGKKTEKEGGELDEDKEDKSKTNGKQTLEHLLLELQSLQDLDYDPDVDLLIRVDNFFNNLGMFDED